MFFLHGNLIIGFYHHVDDSTSILQFQHLIFLLCTQCRKAYQARYLLVGFFRIFHLFNHDSDHPLIISIATRTNCKSPSTSWKLKSSAFLIAETTTSPFELDAAKAIRDFLDASIAKFTSCACKNILCEKLKVESLTLYHTNRTICVGVICRKYQYILGRILVPLHFFC